MTDDRTQRGPGSNTVPASFEKSTQADEVNHNTLRLTPIRTIARVGGHVCVDNDRMCRGISEAHHLVGLH